MNLCKTVAVFMMLTAILMAGTGGKGMSQKVYHIVDNPYIYMMAEMENGSIRKYHGYDTTFIRVQPFGTDQTLEQTVAFCGDQSGKFQGKTGLVVMTYEKTMSMEFCYDLLSVHQVER